MFPMQQVAEILHFRVSHTWLIIRAQSFHLRPKKNLATIHP